MPVKAAGDAQTRVPPITRVASANARACRECGSDASTGWKDGDEIDYQSVEIPDGYGGEFDAKAPRAAWRKHGAVAVLLLCALALLLATLLRWG